MFIGMNRFKGRKDAVGDFEGGLEEPRQLP